MKSYTVSVCNALIKAGCYLKGEFVLKSGERSDTYVDCRKAFSSSMSLSTIIPAYIEELGRSFDDHTMLCGIPTSGLVLVGGILQRAAVHREVRACYLRPETKDHGTQKNFEGDVRQGDKVIILDDVLTSGGTVLDAIRKLQDRGLQVSLALVLLDREQVDFKAMAAGLGVEYRSLITLSELQAYYDSMHSSQTNPRSRHDREG